MSEQLEGGRERTTPDRLDEIERLVHETIPEPDATRWRYEVIMEMVAELRRFNAENRALRSDITRTRIAVEAALRAAKGAER